MPSNMPQVRVGIGFDVHPFATGRELILGGVVIPHTHGLAGHSDADALLHAVADSIFGALGLGDIGQHFPNTDPTWKDRSSRVFVEYAVEKAREHGFQIGNIDSTILAERPKIGPYVQQMRSNIAEMLGITADRVGIKATTMEKMGFVGREEGIAAMAVVLLVGCGC